MQTKFIQPPKREYEMPGKLPAGNTAKENFVGRTTESIEMKYCLFHKMRHLTVKAQNYQSQNIKAELYLKEHSEESI